MNRSNVPMMLAALALSAVTVLAFTSADTGARTLTASVVNDSAAFIALTPGTPHACTTVDNSADGITIDFLDTTDVNCGTGINVDSTYVWNDLVTITNKIGEAMDLTVTVGGADAAHCNVAFDGASFGQTATSTALAAAGTLLLDFQLDAVGLSAQALDCTITVTATQA